MLGNGPVEGEPAGSGNGPDADNGDDNPAAVESAGSVVPATDGGADASKNSADDSAITAPARDIEAIVRGVLMGTYNRYWRSSDTETLQRVVEILNDPALVKHPRFEAASRVRAALWQGTPLGGPSAAATCNVFFAVGREDEVGQIAREAAEYAAGIVY
jgi:hypothetical protein